MSSLDALKAKLAATAALRPVGRVVGVTGLSLRFSMPGVRVGDVVLIKRRGEPLACEVGGFDHGEATGNLDTSGCTTGDAPVKRAGPVEVSARVPPWRSCWNLPTGGLVLSYVWLQTNDPVPQKSNIGFWGAINGADVYAKADAYACRGLPSSGLGHDTSGDRTYRCTAEKALLFSTSPRLLDGAYRADGTRPQWDVQVAVSLDDDGNWDSLGGANYRLSF